MSSPAGSVRKRKDANIPAKTKDASATGVAAPRDAELEALVKANVQKSGVEWDYRIALSIITLLAFITRFWGISHPNEVVFDEVHFGKVHHIIGEPLGETSLLTSLLTVCLILPRANVLLRCPPSLRKAPFRPYGMVRGI
jgi:hypothetical protein